MGEGMKTDCNGLVVKHLKPTEILDKLLKLLQLLTEFTLS